MKYELVTNETLLEVKEDHEVLGKRGTIYSIIDFLPDIETGESKLVLGKSDYDTERGQVCTQLFGVIDKLQVENFFSLVEETYPNYILKLSTSHFDGKESQTKKRRRFYKRDTK
ncbi:hypothetical protein [Bacillus toyonensis]|uniref:hypothetical protein n=1 Tax=Bacillus toyonensis TaxID=155322 RepID=UPI000BF96DC5|nr:hypothetical protein [Bacillus toyonensis]PGF05319.1 hypothetical protein COM61_02595 [Bacillus toyonensis]